MKHKISSIINGVTPISDKSLRKKGELITSVGQPNNLEYFMIEGICKSFLNTPNGESVTISFFMPNSIISPATTRTKNGKSLINIQALINGEIATIDAEKFEKLMIDDLEIRDWGNSVLRNELMAKVQKEIALASLRGKERLELLRKNFPNIENYISHPDIASYLGITPESLSRLRTQS